MIKLEAGKTYLDRKGDKHGPLVHNLKMVGTRREYSLEGCGLDCAWRADGRFYNSGESPLDLIVEAKTTMRNSTNYKHEVRRPTDYNDGTIHGWNGGDCPVHPETVVEVWFREGGREELLADAYVWTCHFNEGDIISFRVVKAYVEPNVIWVVKEDDRIDWIADNEASAREYAGKDPENRRVVKYVECKE